ncbi:MAG: cytochrome c biogenesis CcdA family protein [Pseudonocardiaceae bacterium]
MTDFGPGTYGLGLAAGALSTLSPCVLPLVPILAAPALSAHRFGRVALAGGLSVSCTAVGTLVATLGASLGLTDDTFSYVAALPMVACGLEMVFVAVQRAFARATSVLSGARQGILARIKDEGLLAQFAAGLFLEVVWSPCVGPTLGAASTLASQGRSLGHIAVLMAVFGVGATLPLLLLGAASRASLMKMHTRLGAAGRSVLGDSPLSSARLC